MLHKIKRMASKHLVNMPGWRTKRNIVVFESDDWGMIRMSSREAYDWFVDHGYSVDHCLYNKNDTIEANQDVELLFETLDGVRDKHGNPPVFTANNVVGNPDFEKIKASDFNEYHFEPFTETLLRYPGRDRVMDLYDQGIKEGFFRPQFHGREHLNVNRWMEELNAGNPTFQDAFKHNMFTVSHSNKSSGKHSCLDAFGLSYETEYQSLSEIIETGLNLFEEIWGFRSASFVAPCYVWPQEIEKTLHKNGIKYIQGTHVQRVPLEDKKGRIERKYHYLGQTNKLGQRYLLRNVLFEPTENGRSNAVEKALNDIDIAFKYNKPAIISSHRVNYMGGLRPENRDQNLKLLAELLSRLVEKYPHLEFMSSDQLGDLMTAKDKD